MLIMHIGYLACFHAISLTDRHTERLYIVTLAAHARAPRVNYYRPFEMDENGRYIYTVDTCALTSVKYYYNYHGVHAAYNSKDQERLQRT